MCNPFTRINNPFLQIFYSFPRIGQFILSDCNSFPRLKIVLWYCNSLPRITHFVPSMYTFRSLGLYIIPSNFLQFERNECLIRGNELQLERTDSVIRGNGLLYSREQITNPWELINKPWEHIAQFDVTVYLCIFFFFWKSTCPLRAFVLFTPHMNYRKN